MGRERRLLETPKIAVQSPHSHKRICKNAPMGSDMILPLIRSLNIDGNIGERQKAHL
jgi:hypothetical protein